MQSQIEDIKLTVPGVSAGGMFRKTYVKVRGIYIYNAAVSFLVSRSGLQTARIPCIFE
jgi:hypothetical protein